MTVALTVSFKLINFNIYTDINDWQVTYEMSTTITVFDRKCGLRPFHGHVSKICLRKGVAPFASDN